MEIIDLSWKIDKIKRNNNNLLPRSIRGIIVGKSGCGKTTLLLDLLLRPRWLDYNNLQVFGISLFQPEYKILRSSFERKLPKEVILKLFELQKEIEKSDTNVESIIERISSLAKPGDRGSLETKPSARSAKSHEVGFRKDPSASVESDIECSEARRSLIANFFETADDVPDPVKLDDNKNNLMILDDLQLTKQNKCEKYYIRGRHSNVDSI